MDKVLINNRFIEAISFILSNKIAKNKAEISNNFGISASKFSEILNNRMNAGIELYSNISEIYNISADWLLTGKGNMFKSDNKISVSSENTNNKESLDMIVRLVRENERLRMENEVLKKHSSTPKYYNFDEPEILIAAEPAVPYLKKKNIY